MPLAGIAVEIAGKALDGKNRFEIRLDPPELGRIDVRLDVDRDGQVTSHLTVDRAERSICCAATPPASNARCRTPGFKTSDNGLQFSLRDQSHAASSRTTRGRTRQPMRLISTTTRCPAPQRRSAAMAAWPAWAAASTSGCEETP